MRPNPYERLQAVAAKLEAILERQQRLIAESELVLKEAEHRLRPDRTRHREHARRRVHV